MKISFKSILLATAASGLLLATAPVSFAAGDNMQTLSASVATSLKDIGVKSFNLNAVTDDQLLQIENILQSAGKARDKKAAIETLLSSSTDMKEDAKLSKDVPSSAGLRDRVVTGAKGVGITIAKPGNLSISQLDKIAVILGSSDHSQLKADEIKNILADSQDTNPDTAQDVSAMRATVVAEANALGVTISAAENLTIDQLNQLTGIMNSSDKAGEKKAAVMNVLSSN